jgi:hypothetical protein
MIIVAQVLIRRGGRLTILIKKRGLTFMGYRQLGHLRLIELVKTRSNCHIKGFKVGIHTLGVGIVVVMER